MQLSLITKLDKGLRLLRLANILYNINIASILPLLIIDFEADLVALGLTPE